jgi:hypothetical protein
MSIRGLLFQWASTIKNPAKLVGIVQSGHHHHHHYIDNKLVIDVI